MKELIPDEIHSAAEAASEMMDIVRETPYFLIKQISFALLPIVAGALAGWLYISNISFEQLAGIKDVVSSFITIVTVLAGFIVTLMLFTGRSHGAENLSLDDTSTYINKLVFLQFTQILTLIVHVACVLASLGWLLVYACGASTLYINSLFSITTALMALSMVRTILMPFQIFEVHYFELSVLRMDKQNKLKSENSGFFVEVESSSKSEKQD